MKIKNISITIIIMFIFLITLIPAVISEEQICTNPDDSVNFELYNDSLVLFYSYTCPHCHEEMKFLENTVKKIYPNLNMHFYEISRAENEKHRELFNLFANKYNSSTSGVPRTFISGRAFIGFDKGNGELNYNPAYKANIGYKNQLMASIDELAASQNMTKCSEDNTKEKNNYSAFYSFLILLLYLPTYFIFKKTFTNKPQYKRYWLSGLVFSILASVFVFIMIIPESLISGFAQKMPFGLFVSIIALADGFNPCAFTVLFILLSLLTYTKNKKTMFHIGNTFIIISAIMYFIFIMIMVLVGSVIIEKHGEIILKILGIVILIAGTINLKDFIFFKKGFSLTLSKNETSKITKKARQIITRLKNDTTRKGFWMAILATALLAVGVNIVELGCSAILPAVYMSALISKYGEISIIHYIWTAIYSLIYVLPLYAILLNFIYTFKSERISEDQGRILKLIAGTFMLICGIIMVINPNLLTLG